MIGHLHAITILLHTTKNAKKKGSNNLYQDLTKIRMPVPNNNYIPKELFTKFNHYCVKQSKHKSF